ncbi:single-stranded DNA-binding protein [Candidatus Nephthysia bennettiae]|uniref:Single-stranded DNA-binding protein n=1 Tax=Candidatus Nephthysia bennettiae TaxID=3127016 RepID=A0A934K7D7_9BACT|nr:single-stranded DNA-binding protein [Candidatus Dormibacteraeota bacterium]MBJ7614276.1 single-stranded DNA-binding protein [Candidatus Dormibacteraeota bacterium]
MNTVSLIGNLGKVEISAVGDGKVVGKAMLAVPRMRAGERIGNDWIPVVLWERQALNASRYLETGATVALEGRLESHFRARVSGTEDGLRSRLLVEVVVNRITYLSPLLLSETAGQK